MAEKCDCGKDCANCPKVTELIIEKSKLFDDNSRLRQILNQASSVLARALTK